MHDAPASILLGPRDFMTAMDRLDTMFLNGGFRHHPERRRMMAKARRLERAGQAQLGPGCSPLRLAEAVSAILTYYEELQERRPEERRYREAAQAAAAAEL
jgi:hypothetical protein